MGLFDDLKDAVVGGAKAVGGGIADIAAGPGIPGGDPNVGRQQALQQMGLGMLASDSPDALQAFAQSAQQSQAYRMEYQQMMLDHQRQQEFAALASEVGYDPEGVAQLYFKALADGNIPMAKTLSEVMKSMPGPAAPVKLDKTVRSITDPETGLTEDWAIWSDPYTGQEVRRNKIGKTQREPDAHGRVLAGRPQRPDSRGPHGVHPGRRSGRGRLAGQAGWRRRRRQEHREGPLAGCHPGR